MSQITRCPSCATMFKVVADQLRISDGWVRCGQCKEVFDASAHLILFEPQALLPDLPIAGARPLHKPVERAADAGRASGGASEGVVDPAALALPVPPGVAEDLSQEAPASDAGLDMPAPEGASFLVAEAASVSAAAMQPAPLLAADTDTDKALTANVPETSTPTEESPLQAIPATAMDERLAGYELPAAETEDAQWFDGAPVGSETSVAVAPDTPLPLLHPQAVEGPATSGFGEERAGAQQHPQWSGAQEPGSEQMTSPSSDTPDSPDDLASHLASGAESGDELEEASPGDMPPSQAEDDPRQEASNAQEVSFVRAAKRKAFWQSPPVRAGLGLVAVVLLCILALQVALQERDRIVAMDSRTGPWLQMLCEPFQCALAPLRQISEVVIDSSSFNKGRGESYQLAFAIKNRASVPLAMPAMELTLTDAQDQPVLRRVLLPNELAAPAEMPALGEWATSVAVIVTPGGARVAGYRLLAFYP